MAGSTTAAGGDLQAVPGDPVAVTRSRQAMRTACTCATGACATEAVEALQAWEGENQAARKTMWTSGEAAASRYGLYVRAATKCQEVLTEISWHEGLDADRKAKEALLDSLQQLADEGCACADMSCFEAVGRRASDALLPPPSFTDEQRGRLGKISRQQAECTERFKATGQPSP